MSIDHNAQNAWYAKFQQWDYGQGDINQLMYGEITPPLFNLQSIRVPTAVIYSSQYETQDIEGFLLEPVLSRFNSVIYSQKLDIAPVEAFYMGADMSWFVPEVVPLI